jgi:hypothetical protein
VPCAQAINDDAVVVAMPDAQRKGVLPAAARIGVGEVAHAIAGKQLAAARDDARLDVLESRNADAPEGRNCPITSDRYATGSSSSRAIRSTSRPGCISTVDACQTRVPDSYLP